MSYLVSILTRCGLPPCHWGLPVDDWGHDDGGLSSEARERILGRGPLVFRACLVGPHLPWAFKRKKESQRGEPRLAIREPTSEKLVPTIRITRGSMLGGGAATIAFMGSGGPPVETSLMRPLGEDGEWPAFPNAVVNFRLNHRGFS